MKILVCYMTYPGSKYYRNVLNTPLIQYFNNDERFDVVLLEGNGVGNEAFNTGSILYCPCEESYENLHLKTYHMIKYAVKSNYDFVLKIDDDLFLKDDILPETFVRQFMTADLCGLPIVKDRASLQRWYKALDMEGNLDGFTFDGDYAKAVAGICYSLSRKAMTKILPIIEEEFVTEPCPEDQMIGEAFHRVQEENLFSFNYLNEDIADHCFYDTKKGCIAELTYEFRKPYKFLTKKVRAMPKVTCICPTFGRTEFLQEAIYHFLAQDYVNKELIVLNDNPKIHYHIPYPNVVVVNVSTRFKTLGVKRNWMLNAGTGKYIVPWDDDDIHLPNRITSLMTGMLAKEDKRFYGENGCYAWNRYRNRLAKCGEGRRHGGGYATNIFCRKTALIVGGYGSFDRCEDSHLWKRLNKYGVDMTIDEDSSKRSSYVISHGRHVRTQHESSMEDLHNRITERGIVTIVPQLSVDTIQAIECLAEFINNDKFEEWDIEYPMFNEDPEKP